MTKKSDNIDDLLKNLKRCFSSEEDQLNFIATSLGVSALQSMFIYKNKSCLEIPMDIHYAMAITCSNILAFKAGEEMKMMDIEIEMPENYKEKLILVLKMIIENYKQELGL